MTPIGTPLQNDILKDYTPSGASFQTGISEAVFQRDPHNGLLISAQIAERDYVRVAALKAVFEAAGDHAGLPPAVLAAIASRESHCGLLLDKNGWGDNGNAYGICQIDKRSHAILPDSPDSLVYLNLVAAILSANLHTIKDRHPNWTAAIQLQGAIAAYNVGCGNIQTEDGIDLGTTHNDYSNDVWARAQYYAGLCGV